MDHDNLDVYKRQMKRTIESIGTVDMRDTSLYLAGQITIHMALEEIQNEADAIIESCMERYSKNYPGVDTENDIYWDFGVVYTSCLLYTSRCV